MNLIHHLEWYSEHKKCYMNNLAIGTDDDAISEEDVGDDN